MGSYPNKRVASHQEKGGGERTKAGKGRFAKPKVPAKE